MPPLEHPGGARTLTLAIALALVAVSLAAVPASAQSSDGVLHFTVTALEGEACEETFCFDVPVLAVAPNTTVNITFDNPTGNDLHSFYVMEDGEITGGTSQSPGDALAGVDTLSEGESASTGAFTVPAEDGSLYLWCNEPGHPESGMWEFMSVGAAAPGGEGGEGGLVAQQVGVPLFSYWVGVIAIFTMLGWLAVAFYVLRYQSSHHTDHRDRKKS